MSQSFSAHGVSAPVVKALGHELWRERTSALVFVRKTHRGDELARELTRDHDPRTAVVHGNMSRNGGERSLGRIEASRVSTRQSPGGGRRRDGRA